MNDRETGEALLRQVALDPAPAPKMVYADWLEEQGKPDLAAAYRWAAGRRLHPRTTPVKGWATWARANKRGTTRGPHVIHPAVYGMLSNKFQIRGQYRSLSLAFEALGLALAALRKLVS